MPDFSWSEIAGRFRDRSTGRFVPEVTVRSGVDALVHQASIKMDAAATSLRAGDISVAQFQRELHQTIRDVHIASALAAYGGRDAMTPARWGYVGSQIKTQYEYGRKFVTAIVDGGQPMNGRINVRAQMYAEAGRVTYESVRARESASRGYTQERNILHSSESCRQCIELSGKDWVEIGTLPAIGSRLCMSRCRCSISRR